MDAGGFGWQNIPIRLEVRRMRLVGLCVVVSGLLGCSDFGGRPGPIIEKAEACGAGDLSRTSFIATRDWFQRHHDCAVAVDTACLPIRESAPAQWTDSVDGRVCSAARDVAQWIGKPSKDHRTFQSGWK